MKYCIAKDVLEDFSTSQKHSKYGCQWALFGLEKMAESKWCISCCHLIRFQSFRAYWSQVFLLCHWWIGSCFQINPAVMGFFAKYRRKLLLAKGFSNEWFQYLSLLEFFRSIIILRFFSPIPHDAETENRDCFSVFFNCTNLDLPWKFCLQSQLS